jgi:hypothetical protein
MISPPRRGAGVGYHFGFAISDCGIDHGLTRKKIKNVGANGYVPLPHPRPLTLYKRGEVGFDLQA